MIPNWPEWFFKTSLSRCLENARIVMFEGPLDPENMAKVVNSGVEHESGYHLFDDLDRKTIDKITRELAPKCRGRDTFMVLNFRKFRVVNPLYDMVKGMKPWLAFLNRVDQWHELARGYADCYLAGDLAKLKSQGLRFPSRHHSVINHRDKIFYKKMLGHFETGDAVAFVGAPHMRGVSKLLREAGFQIKGPAIPDGR
ncbi:MAG: hypothetical protein WBM69_29360 [Desulfobacterales bacterium]